MKRKEPKTMKAIRRINKPKKEDKLREYEHNLCVFHKEIENDRN